MDEITIGARLRTLRRWRGLTQAELAGLARLSASFVSMVETGTRSLDRRSHVAALAEALRVSEADLAGGPHLSADRTQADPHMTIPPLRVALSTNTLASPAADRARPLPELHRQVFGQIERARRVCDYAEVGELLPPCLDELHWHAVRNAGGASRQLALATLVEACVIGAAVSKELGYLDLAHLAALRAQEAAACLDDPVERGKADFIWLLTLPRAGSQDRNLAVAEKAAGRLEPHARDRLGLEILGMLTLTASMSAATALKPAAAQHWLGQARDIASRVPDDPVVGWQSFSRANVAAWRLAVGVESGESGGAIRGLAGEVNLGLFEPRSSRRASIMADVGRGLARERGTRAEAVRWLRRAEETAPSRIRNNAAVREAIGYLLSRATAAAGGRELRGMAARMGLPH